LICLYILAVSVISALSVFAMSDLHKRDIVADGVMQDLQTTEAKVTRSAL
jgi:hypothetical protein